MKNLLPVSRTKAQARRYYDRLSHIYDPLTKSEAGLIRRGAKMLSVQPGEDLLEIGCGTGRALQIFTETAPGEGLRVGLDLSARMLTQIQSKSIAPILVQGDGACLPLQTARFDAIFMAFTLELFSEADIYRVLSECRRVLRPAGRLGVVALASTPRTFALRLYERAHRLFPVAVDCRPIPLDALLAENGFECVQIKKNLNWGLPAHLTVSTKRQPEEITTTPQKPNNDA